MWIVSCVLYELDVTILNCIKQITRSNYYNFQSRRSKTKAVKLILANCELEPDFIAKMLDLDTNCTNDADIGKGIPACHYINLITYKFIFSVLN